MTAPTVMGQRDPSSHLRSAVGNAQTVPMTGAAGSGNGSSDSSWRAAVEEMRRLGRAHPQGVTVTESGRLIIGEDPERQTAVALVAQGAGAQGNVVNALTQRRRRYGSVRTFEVPGDALGALLVELQATGTPDYRGGGEDLVRLYIKPMLEEALQRDASDIHLAVGPETGLRFRIAGLLEPPRTDSLRTILPQDGRRLLESLVNAAVDVARQGAFAAFALTRQQFPDAFPKGLSEIRGQRLPASSDGSVLVMRLHVQRHRSSDIGSIGFAAHETWLLKRFCAMGQGMVVVSAPPNHGKTTTLHSCLLHQRVLTQDRGRIYTMEDPVEVEVPGITQISIGSHRDADGHAQGHSGRTVLEALLRADPNVIMVGEMREQAMARLALDAARTGVMIWSTLHTPDAASIIDRLRGWLDPWELRQPEVLRGLVAQRLLRQVCPHCRLPVEEALAAQAIDPGLGARALKLGGTPMTVRPGGCSYCRGAGHLGRRAVGEVIETDRDVLGLMAQGEMAQARRSLRERGHCGLMDHAVRLLRAGEIPPEDIERTIGLLPMPEALEGPA